VLDGISLENELSGVVYHAIGVNGAKYLDFARAQYFATHVGNLQPDLIVISLGTNEAQGATGPKGLYAQMNELVGQLQQVAPNTPILLTTPADSYLRGKGFNPYMEPVSEVIRRFAADHQLALWDLFAISGGARSAQNWKSLGLMSKDSVHYSKTGYAVQGKLFYLSLINGYNQYVDYFSENK
jgi:lysophospholipase L1-like esterase